MQHCILTVNTFDDRVRACLNARFHVCSRGNKSAPHLALTLFHSSGWATRESRCVCVCRGVFPEFRKNNAEAFPVRTPSSVGRSCCLPPVSCTCLTHPCFSVRPHVGGCRSRTTKNPPQKKKKNIKVKLREKCCFTL